jgi:hypothetical protein
MNNVAQITAAITALETVGGHEATSAARLLREEPTAYNVSCLVSRFESWGWGTGGGSPGAHERLAALQAVRAVAS